jgi:acetyl esterase/lipase
MSDAGNPVRRTGFGPPRSISSEAQELLAAPPFPTPLYPSTDDPAAWRRHVAEQDMALRSFFAGLDAIEGVAAHRDSIAGVPIYGATPDGADPAHILYDIHGGALLYMGGSMVAGSATLAAVRTGFAVLSPDYRMPPDAPYPAGLDDCVAVYAALIERFGATNIVVSGSSAGGNLAAATILRARDEGLPLPAGVALLTPEVDLTESGDSFRTLLGLDRLGLLMPLNLLYAAGTRLDHPYLSPLFGDFTKGFPRTFLQAGTRDMFLSNTVRMHRALRNAGIEAELHVWEAMPHGGFGGAPEDEELAAEFRRFVQSCFA